MDCFAMLAMTREWEGELRFKSTGRLERCLHFDMWRWGDIGK